MDIGRPEDFLLGTRMYLEYLRVNGNLEHRDPPNFLGNVLIVSMYCFIQNGFVASVRENWAGMRDRPRRNPRT